MSKVNQKEKILSSTVGYKNFFTVVRSASQNDNACVAVNGNKPLACAGISISENNNDVFYNKKKKESVSINKFHIYIL